jgi:ribulose-5-phosphate 4-epimerase/fuculose-1-phosphate aldolase
VMLERLGPTVWHHSPGSAMALLEELEETARLWLLTDRSTEPLTETQIADLRTRFNALW